MQPINLFILIFNLEASIPTISSVDTPPYAVEERKISTTNATPQQILDLISQFSEMNLKGEEEKRKK